MLYIVPTPIGNIKDITFRAVEVLRRVNVILCEDTRVTRKLLGLLDIDFLQKRFISYFEHNEERKMPEVLEMLEDGIDVAVVSDAGTPVISDPGYKLVRTVVRDHPDIKVEVLPGAGSITTALVRSGFPPDKFAFVGYVPRKDSHRAKLWEKMTNDFTYVAFESGHRIQSTLKSLDEFFDNKALVCLCQELTKMHERMEFGSARELLAKLEGARIDLRGELVLLVSLK